jgi:hypothetical protein
MEKNTIAKYAPVASVILVFAIIKTVLLIKGVLPSELAVSEKE